ERLTRVVKRHNDAQETRGIGHIKSCQTVELSALFSILSGRFSEKNINSLAENAPGRRKQKSPGW
ncbi:hypothetical protein V6330_12170, partial [Citrobacter portucalensis]|uniref:hypothetical protein n=1 Tax=Citrobacter portucalensis TaxID=1639133 RepID=UPI002FE50DD0